MQTDEHKTGLVPLVYLEGALGPKDYALLLTDWRAIFVLEDSGFATSMGHAVGGVVGGTIAGAVWKPRTFDYVGIHPELLAQDLKNTVVFHSSLESIEFQRHFGGIYKFHIRYRRTDGTTKKLVFAPAPPKAYIQEKRAQGVKTYAAHLAYIRDAQEAYRRSIPPGVPVRARWLGSEIR